MAKPGAGNAMGQMPQMRGPQPQPGQSTFGPPTGQMPQMGPQNNPWMNAITQGQQATIPGLIGPQGMQAISANMPMRGPMNDPRIRTLGGANPVSQAIQRTGANPAQTNTVMNRLKPTMDSNQNVPPLQVSNPNMAPQPGGMFRPFRSFGG